LGRESISEARGDRLLDGIACIGTFALVSALSLVATAAPCRLIPKSSSANKPAWGKRGMLGRSYSRACEKLNQSELLNEIR
jgi:hypothetical protein